MWTVSGEAGYGPGGAFCGLQPLEEGETQLQNGGEASEATSLPCVWEWPEGRGLPSPLPLAPFTGSMTMAVCSRSSFEPGLQSAAGRRL